MERQLYPASVRYNHSLLLVVVFATWKSLLLCVASVSPGPGYDTSTQLLLRSASYHTTGGPTIITKTVSKLVRWDALYFVSAAHRGYRFEQEWAFGWGLTQVVSAIAKVLRFHDEDPSILSAALAGILTAHVFHLLSVLILYALALRILPLQGTQKTNTALIAAVLHIVSPAGLFLSAPYAESLFSTLNFLGMFLFSTAIHSLNPDKLPALVALLGSGLCWGLASTVRSNGLLSGSILAYHVVNLLRSPSQPGLLWRLFSTGFAGLIVISGAVLPQLIAYQEYCTLNTYSPLPPWCTSMPPSIYTWVQAHYWNVGFLKYWTLSNVPLFLLAIPVLSILLWTSYVAFVHPLYYITPLQNKRVPKTGPNSPSTTITRADEMHFKDCMRYFALPQALLAVLALTNFHVQIINRISSGYPIWYIVIAMAITQTSNGSATGDQSVLGKVMTRFERSAVQKGIFRAMVLYALVQGALYASFLPPA